MMGYYFDGGYGMGFFGLFWMALFWIGIIWFFVWLIKQSKLSGNEYDRTSNNRTPLQILKERYAKGEVKKKEYDEIRKDLEK